MAVSDCVKSQNTAAYNTVRATRFKQHPSWFLHCLFSSSGIKGLVGFHLFSTHSINWTLRINGRYFRDRFPILSACKPNKGCSLLLLLQRSGRSTEAEIQQRGRGASLRSRLAGANSSVQWCGINRTAVVVLYKFQLVLLSGDFNWQPWKRWQSPKAWLYFSTPRHQRRCCDVYTVWTPVFFPFCLKAYPAYDPLNSSREQTQLMSLKTPALLAACMNTKLSKFGLLFKIFLHIKLISQHISLTYR